jgi:hypothetical protein
MPYNPAETKNQWARDDPAFTVLCFVFLLVAAMSYTIAFQVSNPWTFVRVVLGAVLFDFVFLGVLLATLTWWATSLCWFTFRTYNFTPLNLSFLDRSISNKYLRVHSLHSVEQSVEWLYSFDIHCNAFFPLFLILYVLQYFLLPFLLTDGFLPILVSNSLYAVAFCYYHYITFLGYSG